MKEFEPYSKSIKELFGDTNSFYSIPNYQRPYSWTDEQIERLWDDISSAEREKMNSYFLGPIVLIDKKGSYEVVDGQQRLTTLVILFCVLRDAYGEKIKEIDKNLPSRINASIKDNIDNKQRLVLVTQFQNQNEFEQEIVEKINFPKSKLSEKEKEEKKFINAALIFKQKLDSIFVEADGLKRIIELVNYIFTNVEVISIVCSNRSYAIKLFQIINSRGLDLTTSDLIKGDLLAKLEANKEEEQQFISNWNEIDNMKEEFNGETLDYLFTYYEYYLLAENPKRSLYDELTDNFKNKSPNQVIYDFKLFVEAFKEISNTESKYIFSLNYLPNQVFWRAILSTAKHDKYESTEQLYKELVKLYYTYWIAGYTTARIKQISFNIIKWIKEKKDINYIDSKILEKMSEDKAIEFANRALDGNAYYTNWLKPVLLLVEYTQSDNSIVKFVQLDKNLHIEHILPQAWEHYPDWSSKWTKEDAEKYLSKIGNLTLLSGKKNISAQNYPFNAKKAIYGGEGIQSGVTAFEITKMIINKVDWTPSEVIERQKWLKEQIENIFEIDFDAKIIEDEDQKAFVPNVRELEYFNSKKARKLVLNILYTSKTSLQRLEIVKKAYESIKDNLNETDKQQLSNRRQRWENMVRWALSILRINGLAYNVGDGNRWIITDKGKEVFKQESGANV